MEASESTRPRSAAKNCPKCQRLSPSGVPHCDCGFDFATHSAKASYLPPRLRPTATEQVAGSLTYLELIVCILLPVAGIVIGLLRTFRRKSGATTMLTLSVLVLAAALLVLFAVSGSG